MSSAIAIKQQIETIRILAVNQMTATEVLLLQGKSEKEIVERLGLWMLPALCGPFGKVMP